MEPRSSDTSSRSVPRRVAFRRRLVLAALALALPCLFEGIARAEPAPSKFVPPEELERRAAQSPDQMLVGESTRTRFRTDAAVMFWSSSGPRPILEEFWSGSTDATGRVCAVLPHPTNPDVVYVAAAQGGVWKTEDGGLSWTPLTDGLSSLASGALAFDPGDPNVIYYGTGEQHMCGDCFYGDGLFRSVDAGATWTKIAAKTDVGTYIARVVIPEAGSTYMLIASNRGVVRSEDGGNTWTVTLPGLWCTDLAIDPWAPSTVYAAIYGQGIWKSTSGGASWTPLAGGLPTTGFARINLAVMKGNSQVVYASVSDPGGNLFGMYRTFDGGTTWTHLTATPNFLGGQGYYDNVLIVDPANANRCMAGGTFPYRAGFAGVIVTTDGGLHWSDVTEGIDGSQVHPDQHALAFGADNALWLGNDGGVWKTADWGLHWSNRNHDLAVTQFYTLALHPTDPLILLGGNQDNGTLEFRGELGWPQVVGGDGGPCLIDPHHPDTWYTTYVEQSNVIKFHAGSIVGNVTGPWSGDRAGWCDGPLVADPNVANTILLGTYRVWRSGNGGLGWIAISGDLAPSYGYLRAIAVARGSSGTIYTGSSNGYLYVTTDDGTTWNLRTSGLPSSFAIGDIVLDPGDWQVATICVDHASGGRVYGTTNAGASWTDLTGDLVSGVRGLSLALDFQTSPPQMFLGTDYGLYSSTDGGAHWVKDPIPSLVVYDIGVDPANSLVVAATHGRGMWHGLLDKSPPMVAVTAPAGGEFWGVGSQQTITWSATDWLGSVDSVSVEWTANGGVGWMPIAHGLANTGAYPWTIPDQPTSSAGVRITAYDHRRNIGSGAGGMFVITDALAVGEGAQPRLFLEAPWPNPARTHARVRFSVPRPGRVRLEIVDLVGRRVWSQEDVLPAGVYTRRWERAGSPLDPGLYFVRLVTPVGVRAARLVLLR